MASEAPKQTFSPCGRRCLSGAKADEGCWKKRDAAGSGRRPTLLLKSCISSRTPHPSPSATPSPARGEGGSAASSPQISNAGDRRASEALNHTFSPCGRRCLSGAKADEGFGRNATRPGGRRPTLLKKQHLVPHPSSVAFGDTFSRKGRRKAVSPLTPNADIGDYAGALMPIPTFSHKGRRWARSGRDGTAIPSSRVRSLGQDGRNSPCSDGAPSLATAPRVTRSSMCAKTESPAAPNNLGSVSR